MLSATGNLWKHCEMTACRDLCKSHNLRRSGGCDKFGSVSTGSRTDVRKWLQTRRHRVSVRQNTSSDNFSSLLAKFNLSVGLDIVDTLVTAFASSKEFGGLLTKVLSERCSSRLCLVKLSFPPSHPAGKLTNLLVNKVGCFFISTGGLLTVSMDHEPWGETFFTHLQDVSDLQGYQHENWRKPAQVSPRTSECRVQARTTFRTRSRFRSSLLRSRSVR